jgi:hypothetical protein
MVKGQKLRVTADSCDFSMKLLSSTVVSKRREELFPETNSPLCF